jgi:dihydroorotate dehydrogenase
MVLRNIIFPRALGASGVQGFFGDPYYPEYKHSPIIKGVFGNIFKDMGFVAKTATIDPNPGNVQLVKGGFAFKHFLPDAIIPMPFKGAVLNVVGLSNPGFESLLSYGIWQSRTEPFMLSFMAIRKTKEGRLMEAREFVKLMQIYNRFFKTKWGLQVNFSCPNTGHDLKNLITESDEILNILSELEVPLIPKINPVLTPELAHELLEHEFVDALSFSNSVPWGEFPELIDWRKYSEHNRSPLALRGYLSGGLSGAPIFPVIRMWLEKFSNINPNTKPIIAGGGVTSRGDVKTLAMFPSVSAMSIGSAAMVRPWRVRGIIDEVYNCLAED